MIHQHNPSIGDLALERPQLVHKNCQNLGQMLMSEININKNCLQQIYILGIKTPVLKLRIYWLNCRHTSSTSFTSNTLWIPKQEM